MTERQVKVILGVLALLVIAYAGVELLGGGGGGREGGLGLAAAVDGPPTVVRVFEAGGDSVRLDRSGGSAEVNGFPADSGDLRRLMAALDTARAGELVSRNPANHGRLGVGGEGADSVVVGPPGAPSFTFLLGDPGRGGRFVRRPGADEVYLLEGTVETLLGRRAEGWRDRDVAALDTARVRRLELVRGGEETTLVREDGGWRTSGGDPAAAGEVERLLGSLASLRAGGDVPADSVIRAADFSAPDAELRALASPEGGGQPLLALRLVRVGEDGPWLTRRGDRPHTYVLAGYQYDRLFPPPEDLLE